MEPSLLRKETQNMRLGTVVKEAFTERVVSVVGVVGVVRKFLWRFFKNDTRMPK